MMMTMMVMATLTMTKTTNKSVAIFSVNQEPEIQNIVELLQKNLQKRDIFDNSNPSHVIFVGGDGTLLRAIQHYIDDVDHLTFIGVHAGRLGFFCRYSAAEIDLIIEQILTDDLRVLKNHLIEGTFHFRSGHTQSIFALNEIRIENPFHTLNMQVLIDDELLENFYGNGLSVCSSLGSTAYNKSLGGAVLDEGLELLELSEIATIKNREYVSLGSPLVLGKNRTITFKGNFKNAIVGFDHRTQALDNNDDYDSLTVKLSNHHINLAVQQGHTFVAQLRKGFLK